MGNISREASDVPMEKNWASSTLGGVVAAAVIVAEFSPLNEAMRFAAFAAAQKAWGDPAISASVLGGTTLLVEGAAAIVAADVLATDRAGQLVQKINTKLENIGASKFIKTNIATEVAVASVGGSAVLTALKHQQDPERTREQNRRYGLTSATGLGLMLTAEGYAISLGIEHPSPLTVGIGALAVGGMFGAYKWGKNKLAGQAEVVHKTVNNGESPQCLGLSAEDKTKVLEDPRTVFVEEDGNKVPVLVPIDLLYWYNHDYLRSHFGTEDIYYFAHPDLSQKESHEKAYNQVAEFAEKGSVILYDTVTSGKSVYGDLEHELSQQGKEYRRVPITKDGRQRFLYQYDGKIIISEEGSKQFKKAPPVYEVYEAAVARGDITVDAEKGPALKDVIDGEEAEKLWAIYQKPFERLSDSHPINSGFDKAEFLKILKDPEAVKAIYREKGEITTLALFVNNLEHCSWLDARYYKSKYPEALETDNHFIFPGIVTDELKRGASYSVPLMQLLAKVQAMRESPAIISFECTDISYKYIPRIVRFAVSRSGVAKVKSLKQPVSRFDYYAITK